MNVSAKAILRRGSAVLFARNPRDEWELPGGQPEPGESLEGAVRREVLEECNWRVGAARYAGSTAFEVIPGRHVMLVFFECDRESGDASPLATSDEHSRFAWIDVLGERPADLPHCYWRAVHPGDSL
ncbi:NUDIX domain-containing protein [Pandoraea pulmonicola]|uniref:NTP pyrophosphohydrolases containing a Zn-finger, probably nucleic-acid-binding n=1 Tax=Pandoraea pulmonicola TaxID=93221 RepID=A0AAJ4ZBB0_PANPU|nr:NUDIX domain-containing protein [Pandoraea pulmonicola]AJC21099.1 NUDIX hydrolase [Pandoraea pulmonicola]SUA90243.1 NTP pyrophosphohydrolases containing a Zn-finger, probably nucleic-acid-binding [Pandoraea pulmonicola]